jgi:hypothetical protein
MTYTYFKITVFINTSTLNPLIPTCYHLKVLKEKGGCYKIRERMVEPMERHCIFQKIIKKRGLLGGYIGL